MLDRCYSVGNNFGYSTKSSQDLLCEHCCNFYKDSLLHFIISCPFTRQDCEIFWETIDNDCGVDIAASLHNCEDEVLIHMLLHDPCTVLDNPDDQTEFLKITTNYCTKSNCLQIPHNMFKSFCIIYHIILMFL